MRRYLVSSDMECACGVVIHDEKASSQGSSRASTWCVIKTLIIVMALATNLLALHCLALGHSIADDNRQLKLLLQARDINCSVAAASFDHQVMVEYAGLKDELEGAQFEVVELRAELRRARMELVVCKMRNRGRILQSWRHDVQGSHEAVS